MTRQQPQHYQQNNTATNGESTDVASRCCAHRRIDQRATASAFSHPDLGSIELGGLFLSGKKMRALRLPLFADLSGAQCCPPLPSMTAIRLIIVN